MNDQSPVPFERPGPPGRPYAPGPPYDGGDWDDEIRLSDYWRLLVARRWTIVAILSTVVAATMVWTFSQTPVYRATTRIQIDTQDPNVLSFQDVYAAELGSSDALQTQFEILESRTLARSIVEELDLGEVDEFQRDSFVGGFISGVRAWVPTGNQGATTVADPLNGIVDKYLDRLTVAPVRQSRLVDVSFESEDPVFAVGVINAHANNFIEQNLRYRFEANQLATEFLQGNLTTLKINLENAEDALQAYSREHQIIFSEDGESTAAEVLQRVQTQFTDAQAERFRQEAYARQVREGNAQAIAQVTQDTLISNLNAQLTELKAEESDLAVGVGDRMPALQRLRARIAETERQLDEEIAKVLTTVEAEYEVALLNEELLGAAVERQLDLVNRVNQEIIQYNILRREAEAAQGMYENLLNRLGEASVSSTLEASNIRIIDMATVPDDPVRPRKALNLLLALLVGLTLGIGAALVQEHLDDSITSAEQVAQFLGVPTIGLIPRANDRGLGSGYGYSSTYGATVERSENGHKTDLPAATEHRLEFVSHYEPMSLVSEAFRSVRTSLLLSFPDNPPKSILVTSPSPGEGKTVAALNLAISLTQTGARTLLINADMRRPRLDEIFASSGDGGLTGLLSGITPIDEATSSLSVPDLYLLACGALPPNPAELLMSNRFRELILELRDKYDYLVFDSPPVGSVADARVLAHFVDCTMVVVRAGSTSKHLAKHVLDQLNSSGSRTAGVILNDVDLRHGNSYYHSAGYAPYAS